MKNLAVEIIVIISFVSITIISLANSFKTQQQNVEIDVHNPYRMSATLRVKCDWDNTLEEFKLDKEIKVPSKNNVKIIVPNGMKKCQIWPKINILP